MVGRNFYIGNFVWYDVPCNSGYVYIINYKENIYYEYGKTYIESSKTYPKYF